MALSAVLDPAADNPLLGDPWDSGGTVAVLGVILPLAGLSILKAGGFETWPSPRTHRGRDHQIKCVKLLKVLCGLESGENRGGGGSYDGTPDEKPPLF